MTTRGVRAYVTGLQAKLHGAATGTVGGVAEGRRLTKAITGESQCQPQDAPIGSTVVTERIGILCELSLLSVRVPKCASPFSV